MGTIPNSSLPFNDNAVNGDNVDYNAWNQLAQVVQLAVNDNQTQINAIKNAQTTILVAHGVAYPTNPAPSSGQLFYRDDLSQLKMFNGTQWEDVESVVATANGLSINGVAYNISTSAIANTIALRDATGSITAQSFHGNADTATSATSSTNATNATNATNLNNQPASFYATESQVLNTGTQTFNSTGTFTVPANVNRIFIQLWGAGGGGGTGGYNNGTYLYTGCGGAGGGYCEGWVSVTPGQNLSITVGAGGTGAISQNAVGGSQPTYGANGNSGGNTVVSGLTAYGGNGGPSAYNVEVNYGLYPIPSGATYAGAIYGQSGGNSAGNASSASGGGSNAGGAGATALGGAGGANTGIGGAANGNNGSTPGGAGSGATTGAAAVGGNGANGKAIIWW